MQFHSSRRTLYLNLGLGRYRVCKSRHQIGLRALYAIPIYVTQTQCDQRTLWQNTAPSNTMHIMFFRLNMVRVNHFLVHSLQKSRDILTHPIVLHMNMFCYVFSFIYQMSNVQACSLKRTTQGIIYRYLFCINRIHRYKVTYMDTTNPIKFP